MTENSPAYYAVMKTQPIDVIRGNQTPQQFIGFLHGNCVKYMMRFNSNPEANGTCGKGGLSDLKKARQYLEWLIEAEETN